MLEIRKFGELDHSVFLEFGWNTKNGVISVVLMYKTFDVKNEKSNDIKQQD